VLKPRPGNTWEAGGTFNPAAVKLGGKVYMLYRQVSSNCVSTLGLARSSDGFDFGDRLDEPVYVPREPFEVFPGAADLEREDFCKRLAQLRYASGGCFGAEDSRISVMEDRVYVTYVAYNGVDPPRGALTWIRLQDFLNEKWDRWAKPTLITKPDVPDKSIVLLPKKLGGKYVFFHRIFPHIWIDEVESLDELKRRPLWGRPAIRTRPSKWDSRKVGAGAVVEWKGLWLLVYYGVSGWDEYYRLEGLEPSQFYPDDGYKYKVGLMVLRSDDPSSVVYRPDEPLAVPEEWYEVYWSAKPNVLYPTGAVLLSESELVVYYGASDYFVAAGTVDLSELEAELEKGAPF